MGKLIRQISISTWILFIVINVCATWYYVNQINFIHVTDLCVVSDTSNQDCITYDYVDKNSVSCNFYVFSCIVNNMQKDGYCFKVLNSSDKMIDVLLEKDNEKFRLYWDDNDVCECYASVYEKSFLPFTYISRGNISKGDKSYNEV